VSRVLRKGKNDFKKRIKDYEVVVVNPNPKGRPDNVNAGSLLIQMWELHLNNEDVLVNATSEED